MDPDCGAERVTIDRSQLFSLLASQNAFQESVIKILESFQSPSQSLNHQLGFQGLLKISETSISPIQQPSGSNDGTHLQNNINAAATIPEIRGSPSYSSPTIQYQSENARARETYSEKKKQSVSLYDRAGASHLSREYHFQCRHLMTFSFFVRRKVPFDKIGQTNFTQTKCTRNWPRVLRLQDWTLGLG